MEVKMSGAQTGGARQAADSEASNWHVAGESWKQMQDKIWFAQKAVVSQRDQSYGT